MSGDSYLLMGLITAICGLIGTTIMSITQFKTRKLEVVNRNEVEAQNRKLLELTEQLQKQVSEAENWKARFEQEKQIFEEEKSKWIAVPQIRIDCPDPEQSSLFTHLKILLSRVNRDLIVVDDEIKCAVFKNLMANKIMIWYRNRKKIAKRINKQCTGDCKNCMTMSNYQVLELDSFINGMDEYNNYYLNNPAYTEDEQRLLVKACSIFANHHAFAVSLVKSHVENIGTGFIVSKCPKINYDQTNKIYLAAFVLSEDGLNASIAAANGTFKNGNWTIERRINHKNSYILED